MRTLSKLSFAAIVTIAGYAAAQGQRVDIAVVPPDTSLRGLVKAALPPHVGAAVLIRSGGETLFKEVYGSLKLGEPKLVTTGTAFRLAAATKPFTAAAVLKLVGQEKLKPDNVLSEFFDELPDEVGQITVEQLLTHQSGLPQYWSGLDENDPPTQPDGELYFTDADVLEWLTTVTLDFEPGTSSRYVDANYVLLGLIIDQAASQPFEEYLNEAILVPAGMTDGCLLVAGKTEPYDRAIGHDRVRAASTFPKGAVELITNDERVKRLGEGMTQALIQQVLMTSRGYDQSDQSPFSRMRGDGCLYASIDDLEAWFKALEEGQLLNEEAMTLMTTGFVEADPTRALSYFVGRSFTCGWARDEIDGEPRLTNPGATRGFCQTLQWMPDSQSAVAVLVNCDGEWSLDEVGEAVFKIVAKELKANAEAEAKAPPLP